MKNKFSILYFLITVFLLSACSEKAKETPDTEEQIRWKGHIENVNIYRDTYGIPHIYGKSDADAVFGMIYAQCEDDFNRVEVNFLNAMGRLAEAEGESAIYRDLRMRLFVDEEEYKERFESSPEWLKKLMTAWADGINYFLQENPEVKPKVLLHWEPWMCLTFSEGSIGTDIERSVSIRNVQLFYSQQDSSKEALSYLPDQVSQKEKWAEEPKGSNGFAIAPELTSDSSTLFLINPHTSFFFRPELQMVSEEGLNAYGAVTWGQFFIYQGFNERLGWMHTSTEADVFDYYINDIKAVETGLQYNYDGGWKEIESDTVTINYKTESGLKSKQFVTYHTHRGPVIAEKDGKWMSVQIMERPVDAISQSFNRTKASNYEEFLETMNLRTNSSNNTVYADADGNIAYFHGNFMPKRDVSLNWAEPVDGSLPNAEWNGLHELDEMIIIKNPENGWLQNCNSTPFTAAGPASPSPEDFPAYMAPDNENYRGLHAVKVLSGISNYTLDSLQKAAYDPYMPAFEVLIPPLLKALNKQTPSEKEDHSEAIEILKKWDYEWSESSIATTLGVFWATHAINDVAWQAKDRQGSVYDYVAKQMSDQELIRTFKETIEKLNDDFSTWKTAWGEVNRYQRIDGNIRQDFNDDKPSLAVPFASGRWGSLASFGARTYPDTKRMYGTSGNSFVAFVEFGDKVRARSILAGGISGDPESPHFDDQAKMYANLEFKEVLYYKDQLMETKPEIYAPGKREK